MSGGASFTTVKVPLLTKTAKTWTGTDFLGSDWTILERNSGDTGDGSLGYYSANNVTVNSGKLQIQTKKETAPSGRGYTSGALQWNNLCYLYGTLEIRCQFSKAGGLSPALWLLGDNCQQTYKQFEDNAGVCDWPNPGSDEVDFAEILVGNINFVNFQLHNNLGNDQIYYNTGVDLSLAYHVYKMVWSPGKMQWFFDGTDAGSITSHVSTSPMFLIIQNAAGPLGTAVTDSDLPQTMLIDYVSVDPMAY